MSTKTKLSILLFAGISALGASFAGAETDILDYVNPLVGTEGTGHTFPGACVPFGLVQASPDTGNSDWAHCSGYVNGLPIRRFSQTHLSGTGCADLGDAAFFPFVGACPAEFVSPAKDVQVTPGYYACTLTASGVRVEVTATEHVAFYKLHYPEGSRARLLFDPAWGLGPRNGDSSIEGAQITFEPEKGVIRGLVDSKRWVKRQYGFYLKADCAFRVTEHVVTTPKALRNRTDATILDFDANEVVLKIAISATSEAGALENYQEEGAPFDFSEARAKAMSAWRGVLSDAEVLEGTTEQKANFYTALYHLSIQPNNIADVREKPRYSTLSMWDVFRAACPWYTLMNPPIVDGIIESALRQYDEVGYLPVWQLWGQDNHCMIGNHTVPFIVDAYLKGFKFDVEKAWRAVDDSLSKDFEARPKDQFAILDRYGYYPFDLIKGESVSRTLECAYDDACAARMARSLGKDERAKFYEKRANNWKNVIDPETGFARGRDSKGAWREPFSPYALGHGAHTANDFTEGNSFQYSWHVLHDVPGLVEKLGGEKAVLRKLDELFTARADVSEMGNVVDVTGLIGQYAHGNEPSHHVIYLYSLLGHPEKTADYVREVFDRFYHPRADGLCGNDDCGQMSAWYLFSAVGFYPFDPASGVYVFGAPQIPKVRLTFPSHGTLIVTAKNLSKENRYVAKITLNGKLIQGPTITHKELLAGGELVFEMTATPPSRD